MGLPTLRPTPLGAGLGLKRPKRGWTELEKKRKGRKEGLEGMELKGEK